MGPDFIDPGHHTRAAGRVSRNLDGWMLSREDNLAIFRRQARGADVAVVEGVMGLFDGYDGLSEAGSTAQMAKWLGLPVLLVVDARAMARSAAALVHGFASFDPDLTLAGVVFNRIGGAGHLHYLQQALSLPGVRCLGGLPRDQELAIPERHLGLTTAEDHPLAAAYLEPLADFMEAHLDLDGLLAALPVLSIPPETPRRSSPPAVRLGVARDRAFCFYYPENLELLARFGAELVPFSPLKTGNCLPSFTASTWAAATPSFLPPAGCQRGPEAGPIAGSRRGPAHLCRMRRADVPVPGDSGPGGPAHAMAGVLPFRCACCKGSRPWATGRSP